MKFITSTHLKQWADTRECQSLLPELMRRLICASVKQLDKLSFPCGDAVHMPGWDGIVSSPEPIDMVPEGESLWECGVNKDIQTKANDDIIKRAANPLGRIKSDRHSSLLLLGNGLEQMHGLLPINQGGRI